MPAKDLKRHIRDIPDFPVKGIVFKDITPLLRDAKAYRRAIAALTDHYEPRGGEFDLVLGIESRGFIFSAALAYALGKGLVLVRKPGKLPHHTEKIEYALEYGKDSLEIHRDAVDKGQRVLIVDDVLATGGTTRAVIDLVTRMGGRVWECSYLLELEFLNGRAKLNPYPVYSLLQY